MRGGVRRPGETPVSEGGAASCATAVSAVLAVLAVLVLGLAGRCAVAQATDTAERARIAAERADVNARFDAQAAECRRRFVVTACLNDAQRAQREALDSLRRQQLLLDEAQRKRRAADRIEAIRGKQPAADAPPSSARPPSLPKPATTMRLRQPPPPLHDHDIAPAAAPADTAIVQPPAAAAPAPTGKPRVDQADGAAVAARRSDAERARLLRQREQQLRQAEMAAHRQAVQQRNAERAQGNRQPAAPLPVPAAVSGSGR